MTGLGEEVYTDRSAALDALTEESQRMGMYGDASDVQKMVGAAATAISEATRNNFREMLGKPVGSRNIVDPARASLESLGIPLSVLAAIRAGTAKVVCVRYGCHCDLAPGDEPNACVIDDGRRYDCTYAKKYAKKEDCPEWRQYFPAHKTQEAAR